MEHSPLFIHREPGRQCRRFASRPRGHQLSDGTGLDQRRYRCSRASGLHRHPRRAHALHCSARVARRGQSAASPGHRITSRSAARGRAAALRKTDRRGSAAQTGKGSRSSGEVRGRTAARGFLADALRSRPRLRGLRGFGLHSPPRRPLAVVLAVEVEPGDQSRPIAERLVDPHDVARLARSSPEVDLGSARDRPGIDHRAPPLSEQREDRRE